MSDADKDYDRLSTPLDQLQHHGYVSPSFYNLPHGDKGYDLSDSHQKMGESTAYLRRITDGDEMYREAGRTSPMAEKATGALGTSPKKPKAKKKLTVVTTFMRTPKQACKLKHLHKQLSNRANKHTYLQQLCNIAECFKILN